MILSAPARCHDRLVCSFCQDLVNTPMHILIILATKHAHLLCKSDCCSACIHSNQSISRHE